MGAACKEQPIYPLNGRRTRLDFAAMVAMTGGSPSSSVYKSGNVAWAKVVGRPWWPCILFDSWDELANWELPTKIGEKPAVGAQQVICCFLENYNLQVFDKGRGAIREWEHADFRETIATEVEASTKASDPMS